MLGEQLSVVDDSSAAHGVGNSTQAQLPDTLTAGVGNGFGEIPLTEDSSTMSIPASDKFERKSKPAGRGLLRVKRNQAVGTSYAQSAISPGQILLEERTQNNLHKVQLFSSQKVPQPFLDR